MSQTGSGRFPVVNKEARRSGSRREHEAVVPVNHLLKEIFLVMNYLSTTRSVM